MTTLTWLLGALALTQGSEEKNLATARKAFLEWDSKTWDDALASDATLALKITGVREGAIVSASVGYKGREEVKAALEALYQDFKPETRIATRIVRGADVVFMGDVSVSTSDGERKTLPIVAHLKFDDDGKIRHMTLVAVTAQSTPAESR
ncbi:MAG TPA: nuclear transport factor 2 family protein [Planctomycetota bacterium]